MRDYLTNTEFLKEAKNIEYGERMCLTCHECFDIGVNNQYQYNCRKCLIRAYTKGIYKGEIGI